MTTIASLSTDSGVVGDGITNDNTPTLTGTAPANSTVQVYDGSTLLGTTTANSSGAWTYTTGQLSNGTHQITATATTSSGSISSPFPDASTTGVPAGTSLTTVNGNFTSSFDGQIIDGLDINGALIINNSNVTVRNCQADYFIIENTNGTNCTVEYCDFIGGTSGNSVISVVGGNGFTIRYCDVSGAENGIWLEANNCVIEENYIHNLHWSSADPHMDGIQPTGCLNLLIRHNNVDLNVATASSSISIKDGVNNDIDNNRLNGGSYIIYFEGNTTGSDVTNNFFGQYAFGYVAGAAQPSQTYSGNIFNGTAAAGTTSTASAVLSITIDTQAPSAPAISSFSTDTGTVGDGITNDNTLTLTGTAAANSAVRVYDGAALLGTATANGTGAWSYTTGTLLNATHSFTATATDAAGNTGAASAALAVTVETSTILGNNNANTLIGTSGNDTMSGLAGNDTLDGLAGTDTLAGGTGNDLYYLRSVSNTIIENAGEGTDTVVALVSGHTLAANVENGSLWVTSGGTLTGNSLDNVLYGNSGNDTLNGGGGNDTLDGLAGTDTLAGGTGNDLYYLRSVSNTIIENAGAGTDTVVALVSGHTLAANVENGSLWVTSGGTLTGNGLDNVLYGNSGNDTLNGAGGNDTLDGLAGTDTLAGGTGNDFYLLRSLNNTIIENAGEGTDTVVALVSGYTLSANVENGSLWVTSGGTLTGNSLDNALYGNSGNDTLNGGGGNDTLDGLAGTDTLAGGTGNDLYVLRSLSNTIVENAGAGTDTVVALVSGHTLAANVENGSLWVAGTLTGNGVDNVLYGNSGNDTLNGAGGNDTLAGLAGNDILDGGTGDDLMYGGAGNDTFVYNKDGYGKDKIVDFTPGQDVVDMRGLSSLHTFADVQSHAAQVGNDTVITVDANTTLTLQGVQLSSLDQQDFLQI